MDSIVSNYYDGRINVILYTLVVGPMVSDYY